MTKKYEGSIDLAVFESTGEYAYQTVYTRLEGEHSGYAQVSEWTIVNFRRLDDQTVAKAKVAVIDAQIAKKTADLMNELKQLNDDKQRLLALSLDTPTNFSMNIDPVPFTAEPTAL
jgi:hypothetical protein